MEYKVPEQVIKDVATIIDNLRVAPEKGGYLKPFLEFTKPNQEYMINEFRKAGLNFELSKMEPLLEGATKAAAKDDLASSKPSLNIHK